MLPLKPLKTHMGGYDRFALWGLAGRARMSGGFGGPCKGSRRTRECSGPCKNVGSSCPSATSLLLSASLAVTHCVNVCIGD
jgi:hypothetical protein